MRAGGGNNKIIKTELIIFLASRTLSRSKKDLRALKCGRKGAFSSIEPKQKHIVNLVEKHDKDTEVRGVLVDDDNDFL